MIANESMASCTLRKELNSQGVGAGFLSISFHQQSKHILIIDVEQGTAVSAHPEKLKKPQ